MSEKKGIVNPCGKDVVVLIDPTTASTREWVNHFTNKSPFKESDGNSSVSAR